MATKTSPSIPQRGADIRNILEFKDDVSGSEDRAPGAKLSFDTEHSGGGVGSCRLNNAPLRKGKNLWTSRQGGAKIGYYEAPDGENEALLAADAINRYVRRLPTAARMRALRCSIARIRSRDYLKKRCGVTD